MTYARIEPCPHCGGRGFVQAEPDEDGYKVFVACKSCGARGPAATDKFNPERANYTGESSSKAVVSWNRRNRTQKPWSVVNGKYIKPCPHCGGKTSLRSASTYRSKGFSSVYVACGDCGATSKSYLTPKGLADTEFNSKEAKEAVDNWNGRKGW